MHACNPTRPKAHDTVGAHASWCSFAHCDACLRCLAARLLALRSPGERGDAAPAGAHPLVRREQLGPRQAAQAHGVHARVFEEARHGRRERRRRRGRGLARAAPVVLDVQHQAQQHLAPAALHVLGCETPAGTFPYQCRKVKVV